MPKKHALLKLIIVSMMVAMHVIFARFLSFDTGIVRISLGFIPVAVAAMALGPVGGGVVAVLADILGMLINSKGQIYFFPFTISEFMYGFGYGLFLYKKTPSVLRLSLSVGMQFIIINLFITSFWLYLYSIVITGTPRAFFAIFASRIVAALILLPVQVAVINLLNRYLNPYIKNLEI